MDEIKETKEEEFNFNNCFKARLNEIGVIDKNNIIAMINNSLVNWDYIENNFKKFECSLSKKNKENIIKLYEIITEIKKITINTSFDLNMVLNLLSNMNKSNLIDYDFYIYFKKECPFIFRFSNNSIIVAQKIEE